ncbi:cytochrome C assembly family protein [Candidatus Pandoraea novymonadis]|uniref:Inner membrane protein YpjD n=1 Tax=Candidatus Pandoraea novymonadis TaxID=1808959 RepID=A0ABX5FGV9_9BURK|nr:cytochrome c biogenesis protein CcsA [Candidatus Pandoraea novymonadis]PSB92382.1 Inner membrane protein YpjD [Candidatus Pandoraea novymonadis]
MTILLYALTALLYTGLATTAWHGYQCDTATKSFIPQGETSRSVPASKYQPLQYVLFITLIVHGILLYKTIFRADSMHFGFVYALSAMLWLSVCIYSIERLFFPLDSLRILLMPVAALACLMPLIFSNNRVVTFAANPMFKLHFIIANISYGLFALTALHAMLMIYAEHHLHPADSGVQPTGKVSRWLDTLPPLLTMEKLLFRLISAGFILLTLTLVSGVLFSEMLFGLPARIDHKTVFAVISWVMFGSLLTGRHLYGWRGKVAWRWVLVSFLTLLLAYVGSCFVLEVILHRFQEK